MHWETPPVGLAAAERRSAHDLRNLFAIVASAHHLLADRAEPARRDELLAAIEDAARRGAELTTELLGGAAHAGRRRGFDLNERIVLLRPMLKAIAGRAVNVALEVCPSALPIGSDPAAFDAVVLELVSNAVAAIDGPGRILLRTRRTARRVWLLVADDGAGMTPTSAVVHSGREGAHGTGLSRIRHFAAANHGRLHLRSRAGEGTIAGLSLPMLLQARFAGRRDAPGGRHMIAA